MRRSGSLSPTNKLQRRAKPNIPVAILAIHQRRDFQASRSKCQLTICPAPNSWTLPCHCAQPQRLASLAEEPQSAGRAQHELQQEMEEQEAASKAEQTLKEQLLQESQGAALVEHRPSEKLAANDQLHQVRPWS